MPVYKSLLINSLYNLIGIYCTFLLHKTSTNEISPQMSNCCILICYNHRFQMEIKRRDHENGKIIQADKSIADIFTIGNPGLNGWIVWSYPF
jgi:hypothetical protein